MAGVALASTPYRETLAARLAPLRDFLLLFFFVALGGALDLALLGGQIAAALILSAFVLISKPLIILILAGALGYRRRTGFLAGLTVAQISECSLIFVAMGVSLGHVKENALGLVTMVSLMTIAASTYMITYSHQLYAVFEPLLGIVERKGTPKAPSEAVAQMASSYKVILVGLGRFGTAIWLRLHKRGIRVLGVDFNPQAVRRWRDLGLEADFGGASDPEFVAGLPFRRAEWMVSTVPIHPTGLSHEDTRRTLIQLARSAGFSGRISAASHSSGDSEALFGVGVDLVLEPFQDAAGRAVELLSGAVTEDRTDYPEIAAEGRAPG
jgi:voltage-gated potassium channel Kch